MLVGAFTLYRVYRQSCDDLKAKEKEHDEEMRAERARYDAIQKEYRDTLTALYQRAQEGVASTSQAISSLRDVLSEIKQKLDR